MLLLFHYPKYKMEMYLLPLGTSKRQGEYETTNETTKVLWETM